MKPERRADLTPERRLVFARMIDLIARDVAFKQKGLQARVEGKHDYREYWRQRGRRVYRRDLPWVEFAADYREMGAYKAADKYGIPRRSSWWYNQRAMKEVSHATEQR
jgi:hypothetical protein